MQCMIYETYADITQTHRQQYGPQALVLMEVGSFWELYNCDQNRGADMRTVCQLLNIQQSKKNKHLPEVSAANPWMAGFPSHSLQKFLPILLEHCYTVVLVSQVTPPPNPKREVTHVISKGTYLEGMDACARAFNHLSCLYFEHDGTCAAASIDLSTGRSTVLEAAPKAHDPDAGRDELARYLEAVQPSEVLLVGAPTPFAQTILEDLRRSRIHVHDRLGQPLAPTDTCFYQNQMLSKAFTNTGLLSPIEYIDLERFPASLICYVNLLNFAYQHNDKILSNLHKPTLETCGSDMQLSPTAYAQLEVDLLLKLLNRCKTAVGKREFERRIRRPASDPERIQARLDRVQSLLDRGCAAAVRTALEGASDLERLYRKITLGQLHPCQLREVHTTLLVLQQCVPQVYPDDLAKQASLMDAIARQLAHLQQHITLDESDKQRLDDLRRNFLKGDAVPLLSDLQNEVDRTREAIAHVASTLQEQLPAACFKLEHSERDGHGLVCTHKRYQEAKAALAQHPEWTLGSLRVLAAPGNGSYVRLSSDGLKALSEQTERASQQLKQALRQAYLSFLNATTEALGATFQPLADALADIDVLSTHAVNAKEFRYTRPRLLNAGASAGARVELKRVRHPIIERIRTDLPYVPNDVTLGGEAGDDEAAGGGRCGMLLYGLNAAGKSSLMKAVGLSILMAQAGMFVPADHMQWAPYTKLFTRITHTDNLLKGQSTFMVEMSELRNILRRADARTIVLGDELCSGTESVSATAIVASGIVDLCRRGSSFVFASHLHGLPELPCIQALPNLQIYHLAVHFDGACLVYDRVLKTGSGSTVYGLEVCKSLDMDPAFIERAHKIRREMLGTGEAALGTHKSRYNARLFVDACRVCGKRDGVEVHHIAEQCTADADGFIGHAHKNRASNLVPLCSACHEGVHHGELRIQGYVQTSVGVRLAISNKEAPPRATTPAPPALDPEILDFVGKMRGNPKPTAWKRIQEMVFQNFKKRLSVKKLQEGLSLFDTH